MIMLGEWWFCKFVTIPVLREYKIGIILFADIPVKYFFYKLNWTLFIMIIYPVVWSFIVKFLIIYI
jgi:hypothetical protein